MQKTTTAKEKTDSSQIQDRINLAYHSSLVDGQGKVTEPSLESELKKEFNKDTLDEGWLDKTSVAGKWKITIDNVSLEVPAGKTISDNNEKGLTISELQENASEYFGLDVINYAETLPSNLQDIEWQLFYAGALNGETEERIYLISKEYVKNTVLPTKNGARPDVGDNNYKAHFGNDYSSGIMPQYASGSTLITDTKLKKLNKKYFTLLDNNNVSSSNNNMISVAYMMDTSIWNAFKGSYAEYAIGGPTVELLFTAYNKYKNTVYETQVTDKVGYQLRKTSTDTFEGRINNAIENDVVTGNNTIDSPYSVSSLTHQANAYWLASPGKWTNEVLNVDYNGNVTTVYYYGSDYDYGPKNPDRGYRPLILLDENYTLSIAKDSNDNDVFKIVLKSE